MLAGCVLVQTLLSSALLSAPLAPRALRSPSRPAVLMQEVDAPAAPAAPRPSPGNSLPTLELTSPMYARKIPPPPPPPAAFQDDRPQRSSLELCKLLPPRNRRVEARTSNNGRCRSLFTPLRHESASERECSSAALTCPARARPSPLSFSPAAAHAPAYD